MNSFNQLFDDENEGLPPERMRAIEKRVFNAAQPVRFAANTTDLFIPKAIDAMLVLFGANNVKKKAPAPPSHHSDPASGF